MRSKDESFAKFDFSFLSFYIFFFFLNATNSPSRVSRSLYYDSSTSFSKTKIQGNSRGERNEGKEEASHGVGHRTPIESRLLVTHSPLFPQVTSDSSCNHWTQPIPPTSRFLPFLGPVRQTYIHHSAFISSTLTDPSYERERFDYSYHSAYYLILKRPPPPPPVRHFPPKNVSSIAPLPPIPPSPFRPGPLFYSPGLARPPSTVSSPKTSLFSNFARDSFDKAARRSRPRFPLIDSRKCRVPKLKRLKEKRWWERCKLGPKLSPFPPSLFFIPLFITPPQKSVSLLLRCFNSTCYTSRQFHPREGRAISPRPFSAMQLFARKRGKIPAAFLLKNEGTGPRERGRESWNVTAMVSRIFKEGGAKEGVARVGETSCVRELSTGVAAEIVANREERFPGVRKKRKRSGSRL